MLTDNDTSTTSQPTNPVKAIRAKCLDCVCYQVSLIKDCELTHCALWPFRMGKNPFRKPKSEEQRKAAAERLQKVREERSKSQ